MKRFPTYLAAVAVIIFGCGAILFISHTPKSSIRILIGGDIMLDRNIRARGERNGYDSFFEGVAPLFKSADIVVANLEGPITSYPSLTLLPDGEMTDSFTFTFATTTAEALHRAGITALSLANNHAGNWGDPGIDETRHWLDTNGVRWFGDPANTGGTESKLCKKDICVIFIGYHEFQSGFERILSEVTRLSAEKYPIIVMAHWGDEYATTSPERIKNKARQLAAAGASVIIGAHPHIIEDREWIGDVPVIYSLGNLVFDQYWSKAVLTGNIAELTISKNGNTEKIDGVRLYTVSNIKHAGPQLVGDPIEFPR